MNTKREYSLDFLKAVASILIVFHHYQQCLPGDYRICFYPGVGKFSYGYMVELFFLLSGFLIAGYKRRICEGLSFQDYFLRRYFRLFPMMLLSTAGYCVLYYLLKLDRFPSAAWWWLKAPTLWGFIITSLGIQSGWGFVCTPINNPLWYLSVLLFCYILFFLLVHLSERLHFPVWLLYLMMVLLGVVCGNESVNVPFINPLMCRGYYSFFSGLLLADAVRGRTPGKYLTGLCLLLIAAVTVMIPYYTTQELVYILTFLYFPAIVLLLLSKPITKHFRSPVFGFLGKISFDYYVWHMCGILVVLGLTYRGVLNPTAHPLEGMLLFGGCCVLGGVFSYLFLEKPCARLTTYLLSVATKQRRNIVMEQCADENS